MNIPEALGIVLVKLAWLLCLPRYVDSDEESHEAKPKRKERRTPI